MADGFRLMRQRFLYTYDENGNVTETETKSRKEGETDWQTQKTKAVYDSKGQVNKRIQSAWCQRERGGSIYL